MNFHPLLFIFGIAVGLIAIGVAGLILTKIDTRIRYKLVEDKAGSREYFAHYRRWWWPFYQIVPLHSRPLDAWEDKLFQWEQEYFGKKKVIKMKLPEQ